MVFEFKKLSWSFIRIDQLEYATTMVALHLVTMLIKSLEGFKHDLRSHLCLFLARISAVRVHL